MIDSQHCTPLRLSCGSGREGERKGVPAEMAMAMQKLYSLVGRAAGVLGPQEAVAGLRPQQAVVVVTTSLSDSKCWMWTVVTTSNPRPTNRDLDQPTPKSGTRGLKFLPAGLIQLDNLRGADRRNSAASRRNAIRRMRELNGPMSSQ